MSKKVVRILSIDGGGIRGIIPAMILDWIEKRTAEIAMESVESDERPAAIERGTSRDYLPTAKLFDLIAGTSTGGILALALTKPKADPNPERMPENSAERLVQLYESEGKKIFHRSFWSRLPLIGKIVRLAKAKFSADNLKEVLHRYLGGAHLKDAVCDVLIPSYEVEHAHPWFFKSAEAKCRPTYDFSMLDVALATSAAPTYFRPHEMRVTDQDGLYQGKFIDGGIYANHPALCAFAEISAEDADAEFLIVSIGTGESPVQFGKKPNRWGIYFWARKVMNAILDGASETVTYQLNKFLNRIGNNHSYHRFQFQLDEANKDLDNASEKNVLVLKAATERFIREHKDELDALCQRLHQEWLKRQEAA